MITCGYGTKTSKKCGYAREHQIGRNGIFIEWKISYKKNKIRMEKYELRFDLFKTYSINLIFENREEN